MNIQGTPIGNFLNTVGVDNFMGMRTSAPTVEDKVNQARARPTMQQQQSQMAGTAGMDTERLRRLDAQARAAGYPSYEAMRLKEMQMRKGSTQTTTAPGNTGSWSEAWDNAMAWHPKNLINRVTEALRGATGN
jgi:hypothetical protein